MNLSSLFSPFRSRGTPTRNNLPGALAHADGDRLTQYNRFLRAYLGYSLRAPVGATTPLEYRRLKHNFNRPIVDHSAEFLAGKPITWRVDGSEPATKAAFNIWDRSGSDRSFLEAARCAGIYGDIVGLATQDAEGRPRIEFVCADICFPQFSGRDVAQLDALDISWQEETRAERQTTIREFYTPQGRQVFVDGDEDPSQAQVWDAIPAAWIRNLSLRGMPFGYSDLDGITDLVEEYDHATSKRTRTIDYYASPTIVCEGVSSKDVDMSLKTVWFLPKDAKASFLEWGGNQPDVEAHLARMEHDIEKKSRVPAVAYGKQPQGALSGVALRILYGPLLAKTQSKWASWGPSLEYLMHLCLRAEEFDVRQEQVNAIWQSPLPVDELEETQAENTAVAGGFRSIESALARTGVENPRREAAEILRDRRFDTFEQLSKAGAPLLWSARRAGFNDEEIAELEQEQAEKEEKARVEAEAAAEMRLQEMAIRPNGRPAVG